MCTPAWSRRLQHFRTSLYRLWLYASEPKPWCLNISAQTHLRVVWCQNQMLIRHEGSLDKAGLVLWSLCCKLHWDSSVGCLKPRLLGFLCARRNMLRPNSCFWQGRADLAVAAKLSFYVSATILMNLHKQCKRDKAHNSWHCIVVFYDSRVSIRWCSSFLSMCVSACA